MNLFSQGWHLAEEGNRILLRFDVAPDKRLRQTVKACGFKPADKLTWVRRLDHNGRCAARYLKARLTDGVFIAEKHAG